jgi:hypothetical protein
MRLLRESVLLLALGLSLSSATAPGETSFKVKRGQYPWHVWNSPVYKQNYTWPEFRKQVAELNNLPNTEVAFRHLKRDTELKIPALPGATASASDIAKAKADQKAIDDATHSVDKALWDTEKKRLQDALDRAVGSIYSNYSFWLWVLGTLLIGAGIAYFITRRYYDVDPDSSELRRLRAETTHLRHQLRESDARDYFLKEYTYAYEVPDDLGRVFGKTKHVYLLKAEPIEGEEAVYVHGETLPVKVRNLKRYFFEAGRNKPHVLEYYHITKSDREADTVPTGRL